MSLTIYNGRHTTRGNGVAIVSRFEARHIPSHVVPVDLNNLMEYEQDYLCQ